MTISLAGRDITRDVKQRIEQAISSRLPDKAPKFLSPPASALTLLDAESEADYLARLLNLIRYRDAVDMRDFEIQRKPGFLQGILARARAFLWRALRYQHNRVAFQQNLINGLFTGALEFELLQREAEIGELRERLDELEKRISACMPTSQT